MNAREILNKLAQRTDDWYRIVNEGAAGASVYLYDEIGLWGTTAQDFAAEIAAIDAPRLDVYVSSIGGEVFDGIAIYNALRTHPAPVTVRVDSLAASIASVIVQAGDTREMLTGSQMMVHNASTIAMGDAAAMREAADLLDKQNAIIADIYAERSGGNAQDFLELMDAETWMNATEAVDAGLADTVIKPPSKAAKEPEPTDTSTRMWDAFLQSTEIGE